MHDPAFPISPLLPQLCASLAVHPRLVLEAPPGTGKTTQVPLALLDAPWLAQRRIVMLEPRRVAARSAAQFMARQLGEHVGDTVGYRIRFENNTSARTRIEVVTEGILTRLIQNDPMLESVGAILLDEFHERHLAGDLGLALALDVQAQLRQDLRIVVMSATLDGKRLADMLQAPRLHSTGQQHPVDITHFPAHGEEALERQVRRAVAHALFTHPGDVLVFLPGQHEIARAQAVLENTIDPTIRVLPLHGELPVQTQHQALQPDPDGRRRVVLATNVAESSVTLPGVRVVIDSGLAREPRYDPNSGFSRLEVSAIAQASADQRSGRAGRTAPGWAYRLWPASRRLELQRRAEITQVELTGLALELAAWGSHALCFVDAPPAGALAAAHALLLRLGAVSAHGGITALGQNMLGLGTHPRIAAMLLHAATPIQRALACDLAALIEARDPLRQGGDTLAARWRALATFRQGQAPHTANRTALAAIDTAARQWRRRLRCQTPPPSSVETHALGDLLAHAFPDRIAARHPIDPLRYVLSNGRSARLSEHSDLRGEPWLVASELRHDTQDALLLRAVPVAESELRKQFADRFTQQDIVRWDPDKRALVTRREFCFDRIVLDSSPAGRVDPTQAAAALTTAVRELGLEVLPWTEQLRQWRARAHCLRTWMPELALPDLSDAALLRTLEQWLRPAFAGITGLDALDTVTLDAALKTLLPWTQRQQIDDHTPIDIAVPSGMQRRIRYALDHDGTPLAPVLAVKLQELFGMADTPRVASGRIRLVLHLLSPGGRPLQVTQDLKSFWASTYPQIKKEMKGRYPKHPWPDDPWTATATHRAKPRGS